MAGVRLIDVLGTPSPEKARELAQMFRLMPGQTRRTDHARRPIDQKAA
jgi:hypothetical protein